MKKMNKKGFTLIEMLAVIAIIAVLVAIIVPAVGSSTTKAAASADAANLRSVLSAATIEYAETGKLDGLTASVPASKTDGTFGVIKIVKNGDALEAFYVKAAADTTGYSINELATIAQNGTKTAGTSTITCDADFTPKTITCK